MRRSAAGEHLVLFDGECGLCHRAVRFILWADHRQTFVFAPLGKVTAEKMLGDEGKGGKIAGADSLILIERFQSPQATLSLRGRAVLRICWHLGGLWRVLGFFSFLPTFVADGLYRLVARYRYRLFGHVPAGWEASSTARNRFLP